MGNRLISKILIIASKKQQVQNTYSRIDIHRLPKPMIWSMKNDEYN